MRAENPAALRFILQDDIYLLQSDKVNAPQIAAAPVETIAPEPVVQEVTQTLSITVTIQPEVAAPATPVIAPAAPVPETPQTQTPAAQFNYMGGNKKLFLIITHYTHEEHIATDHLAALQSILKRREYEIDDVAIFNMAKYVGISITDLVGHFKPEKLLILGETAVPAGMGVPPLNQLKKMKSGVFLRSFSFDEMMNSTENKKVFWEQMKNL